MKFWQSDHVFNHPWTIVSSAFWRKYPNDYSTSVVGTDTIDRYIDDDGKLHSTRLIISSWKIPSFMKYFMPSPYGYAVEYSVVDPVQKTLELRSRNLNAASLFSFVEKVVYSEESETETKLSHEARISCHACRLLDRKAEEWIESTVDKNAKFGLLGLSSIINMVESEAQMALKAVDEFASDTIKAVDEIAIALDGFKSDTLRSVEGLATETMKSFEEIKNEAQDGMGVIGEEVDRLRTDMLDTGIKST